MFEKLAGDDEAVPMPMTPTMAEMVKRDDYRIIGAVICIEHGLGIMVLADKNTRELEGAKAKNQAMCLVESAKSAIKTVFMAGPDTPRETQLPHHRW